jgi:hypothetical protein
MRAEKTRRNQQDGQTLIEFSFVLALLVVGLFSTEWSFFQVQALNDAAERSVHSGRIAP